MTTLTTQNKMKTKKKQKTKTKQKQLIKCNFYITIHKTIEGITCCCLHVCVCKVRFMAGVVEMEMEYLGYLIYNIYSYGKCMHIIYIYI